MKKLILILVSLFSLTACNDALRTRVGNCQTADNRFVECSKSGDALTAGDYRKKYIAEVSVPIIVGTKQIILNDDAHDIDHDQELTCELDVAKGTQFNYTISKGILTLRNGITLLQLTKTNGSSSEGLVGTWAMSESDKTSQTITEMVFSNLEDVKIRKICNLK